MESVGMGKGKRTDGATDNPPAEALLCGLTVLGAVAEGTTDAVYVKDLRGRYQFTNAVGAALVGRTPDEVIGRDDTELLRSDVAPAVMAEDAKIMATGVSECFEERLMLDGVARTLLTTKGPVRDASGQIIGIFGISRDVTERERANTALQASEEKFRAVFDQSPIGKSITQVDGRVDLNPAMCAMLGYTRDELLQVRWHDLTHPDDVALTEREVAALVSGTQDTVHFQKRFLRKDGAVVWAELHSRLRRDACGAPQYLITTAQDVTQRQRTEDALAESEARYRTLTEWSPEPMLVHQDGLVRYANPAALRLFGLQASDAAGIRSAFQLLTPESRPMAMARGRDLMARGIGASTPPATYEMIDRDGAPRDLEIQGVVVSFDGAPAMLSVVRDVTEPHLKDAALRESEFFFRESQRVAKIGSYRGDFVAGMWKSSEVLDVIFGIDAAYVRSVPGWVDLIHADDQAMMAQYLRDEVMAKGLGFDKEYRITRKNDGVTRWVHGLGALRMAADGSVVGMTGTIQDITERRRAEDALRESEERYRLILQTALDGFWRVDLHGHLLEVNESYAQMSGYSVSELLAMRVSDLDADEPDAEQAQHAARIRERGEDRFEARHRRKDGTLFDVDVSVQYHPAGDGQLVAFLRDITARKRAEAEEARLSAQLQQAQKMESVGRLAGGVAHDFNNMLGVILGHADLALGQLPVGDPLRDDIEEMRRAAERSVELTRQLLAFARKQTVAPQVVNLNATVGGMIKMLKRLIGEDIVLTWRPEDDLWPVKVDPSQVDQVLANLCVNSRDAIAGVGALTITTGHRTFRAEDLATRPEAVPGDYVLLSVRDDGSGMDDHTLAHLFEPFYTTKGLGQGTGLGLATVWGIVRQNGGIIDVVSASGVGTTFDIFLPRHVGKDERAAAAPPVTPTARGKETILVAEDEPGLLKLTARMLEMHGYLVLRASTPGEAVRLAIEHRGDIDLLMTDVVMPEMNGRDLAKNLLALYPQMRRMFMSGYTADVIAHRGVLDDGVHFLQKPFTQAELHHKVREALDAERVPADAP